MKFSVELSFTVTIDIMNAIFMAYNVTSMSHINVYKRYKYVNNYIEDSIVKMIFVNTAKNDSGILMKSLDGVLHEKHSKKIIGKKLK